MNQESTFLMLMDVKSFEKKEHLGPAHYLGNHYDVFHRLSKKGVHSIGQDLENIFKDSKEYLKNIDKILNVKIDEKYLSTTIAENNFYINDFIMLFLKIVYLNTPFKEKQKRIYIFDDASTARLAHKVLVDNKIKASCIVSSDYFKKIKHISKPPYKLLGSLLLELKMWFLVRAARKELSLPLNVNNDQKSEILFFSWVTPSTFYNAQFWSSDRYLGEIPGYLKKNHNKVSIVGKLVDNNKDQKTQIIEILRNEKSSTFVHDFISFPDVIKSHFKLLKFFLFTPYRLMYNGINLSSLLKRQLLSEAFKPRNAQALLTYYLAKNLKNKKIQLHHIFLPFENQNWERVFYYAAKKFLPEATIYAVQFFKFSEKYISMHFSKEISKKKYTPDITIACDEYSRKILLENGHNKVIIGSGYRYQTHSLPKKLNLTDVLEKQKKPLAICACSIDYLDSLELVMKCLQVYKSCNVLSIQLMFHPMMSVEQRETLLKIARSELNLSENPELFDRSKRRIEEAFIVFYSSSSIPYDAILNNVLPIHVQSDITLSGNRFLSDLTLSFQDVEDGKELMKKCIKDSCFYKNKINQMIDFCKESFFIKGEPSVLDAYISFNKPLDIKMLGINK